MAFAAALAELQEEASCPICLDYLRDPVTIACGHDFCPSCIHQRLEGLQDTFPCPVCLHYCSGRSLKRNTQLCHMTEIVQQIPAMRGKRKRQEEPPCKKHCEGLALFCEKDLQVLCAQCRVSSNHQDQPLISMDQPLSPNVTFGMLKSYVEFLTNHLEDAKMEHENQVAKLSK